VRIPQNPGLGERSDDDDPQNPGLGERSNLLGEVSRDMGIGTHPGIRKLVRIPQNPGLGERSNLLGEASRDTGIGAHPGLIVRRLSRVCVSKTINNKITIQLYSTKKIHPGILSRKKNSIQNIDPAIHNL